MLAITLLSTIAILFNATGLEVLLKKDINFNRELCVAGVGNVLSSLVGGITGYVTITDTMLNHKTQHSAATHSRLAGLFAIGFFIVKYSHVSVIKATLKGDYLQSNKQRDPHTQELLQQYGNEILYFQLQIFLFFGNADALLKELSNRLSKSKEVHYVIYDFSHLTGLDRSATVSFEKIKQLAEKKNILIMLTDVDPKVYDLLEKSNVIAGSAHQFIDVLKQIC